MAEVKAVVGFLVCKLGEPFFLEALNVGWFLLGVNDQMDSVRRELERTQCFLKDAESKQKTDERVQKWVIELRHLSFDIEDAIDTYIIEVHDDDNADVSICNFIRWLPKKLVLGPVSLFVLGQKIVKITGKIDEISKSTITYGINKLEDNGRSGGRSLVRSPILPNVENNEVIGFENDMQNVLNQLLDVRLNKEELRVVSIVGPGGLGKTTLAQKVYISTAAKDHFDLRIWLVISQQYNSIDLSKKMLKQVRSIREEEKDEGFEYFLGEINRSLEGIRYLIVLDDVWEGDFWIQIEKALPNSKNGSRILMTTRNLDVANKASSRSIYELRFLNYEESLELLMIKAFKNQDFTQSGHYELRTIAQELAKRCGGLPLAIIVLGRLLSENKNNHYYWRKLVQDLSWKTHGKECMNILFMSYENLPYLCKACFLYLAIFPEDYLIDAKHLIRMWIAEGFISRADQQRVLEEERRELEDIAEDCLQELANRHLIQVTKRNSNDSINYFRVHDLLLELAIREAKEVEFFALPKNNQREMCSEAVPVARRAAIHHEIDDLKRYLPPNLRSLFTFNVKNPRGISFKLLRVMELYGAFGLQRLPEELKNMIHLRYLGLKDTGLDVLSETIRFLQNLQTLDVRGTKLRHVPDSLWVIKALRHVLLNWISTVQIPPSTELSNLQTLGPIEIPMSWQDGLPSLDALRVLELQHVENQHCPIILDLLKTLRKLLQLKIVSSEIPVEIVSSLEKHEQIISLTLNGFIPQINTIKYPQNMTELKMENSCLRDDPFPILEMLRNLKELSLGFGTYLGSKVVASSGKFRSLRSMEIENWDELEEIKIEPGAMPVLRKLSLRGLLQFRIVPDFQHLKAIQELELLGMPLVFANMVRANGSYRYKVNHIPSVIISDC